MLSAQIYILHGVKPLVPTNVLILSNFIGLGRDVLTITAQSFVREGGHVCWVKMGHAREK